jgi:hypothetical protein
VIRETVHFFDAAAYCFDDTSFNTWLHTIWYAYHQPSAGQLMSQDTTLEGKALGEALKAARVQAVTQAIEKLQTWNS